MDEVHNLNQSKLWRLRKEKCVNSVLDVELCGSVCPSWSLHDQTKEVGTQKLRKGEIDREGDSDPKSKLE